MNHRFLPSVGIRDICGQETPGIPSRGFTEGNEENKAPDSNRPKESDFKRKDAKMREDRQVFIKKTHGGLCEVLAIFALKPNGHGYDDHRDLFVLFVAICKKIPLRRGGRKASPGSRPGPHEPLI